MKWNTFMALLWIAVSIEQIVIYLVTDEWFALLLLAVSLVGVWAYRHGLYHDSKVDKQEPR